MAIRHIIRAQQFDTAILDRMFRRADRYAAWKEMPRSERLRLSNKHRGKVLVNLFYQPSTRTRISFGIAAHRLGMHVEPTENAREFSSAIKGESLEDTIRVLNAYEVDVIVLRHYEEGAAQRAAAVSSCPVINAGDGPGQHPTQALLDLYTIRQAHGAIDGLTVVIGGDLARGRTVRSLAYMLSKYKKVRLVFVSPPHLCMGRDIIGHLREHHISFEEHDALEDVVGDADVVYWTRTQTEYPLVPEPEKSSPRGADPVRRLKGYFTRSYPGRAVRTSQTDPDELQKRYRIDGNIIRLMKPTAVIMHPLPRNNELAAEVDDDPRAGYFRQAGNGISVRMAAIEWVLNAA